MYVRKGKKKRLESIAIDTNVRVLKLIIFSYSVCIYACEGISENPKKKVEIDNVSSVHHTMHKKKITSP